MKLKRLIHAIFSVLFSLAIPLQPMQVEAIPLANHDISPLTVSLMTPDHAQAIYRHIVEAHWVPRTGLFLSFPDSIDKKLSQQASTYDQAAMGLLALRFGDLERARGILQFFKEAWITGPQTPGVRFGVHGLTNFYNAEFGGEGIEKTIHTGPNAWAGLFAARLGNLTKDPDAIQWALDVAYWITNGIAHQNGAAAMGPVDDPRGAPWAHVYSTENNVSYYALLTELLRWPAMDLIQRNAITQERDGVENWILNTAYNRFTGRFNRGVSPEGTDTMQALDTVTWIISAIGPRKLAARGIDPHRLMRNAEKSFEVRVGNLSGVDAADQSEADFTFFNDHPEYADQATRPASDRHRMIWYEGLGQYIVALGSMAEYSQHTHRPDLAAHYLEKARRLTQQFDLAALKNYKESAAYPYATRGRFFRDGWRTPAEGPQGPASSLIAAAWRCFAGLGMDPLFGREIGTIQHVQITLPKGIRSARRKPAVLYGTSEDMVVHAWEALDQQEADAAIAQAQATIQEWSPWALQLQEKKMTEVGHLLQYSGIPQQQKAIFNYWALNDVGAAYYILGMAFDDKHRYADAEQAFQQIVNHYSLAQVWDPKGWFWSPVEAITNDYVLRDPSHYGEVMPQVLAEGSTVGKHPY